MWVCLFGMIGLAAPASAMITLYEHDAFQGRAVTMRSSNTNLKSIGFNDEISSIIVSGGSWQVCADDHYRGQCVLLPPGQYPSMRVFGLNDAITSIRPYGRGGDVGYPYARAAPPAGYDPYTLRPGEHLYKAPVVAVRAVIDRGGERCWTERGEYDDDINAAVTGAIIGGILGHQIGGGSGRDAATAIGAAAGAAIASNHAGSLTYGPEVRRCEPNWSGNIAYWDVTYHFRGRDHYTRMRYRPGPTIMVNAYGEPRQ